MMSTGLAPWQVANDKDEAFNYITRHGMRELLDAWDVLDYVDDAFLDLVHSIFEVEAHRFSIEQVRRHPFVKNVK